MPAMYNLSSQTAKEDQFSEDGNSGRGTVSLKNSVQTNGRGAILVSFLAIMLALVAVAAASLLRQ